ncbi:MAG: hypothetical protein ACI8Y7_000603 [Candidatus Woesearchaeota archaeon]|jgi:hypothetical protein
MNRTRGQAASEYIIILVVLLLLVAVILTSFQSTQNGVQSANTAARDAYLAALPVGVTEYFFGPECGFIQVHNNNDVQINITQISLDNSAITTGDLPVILSARESTYVHTCDKRPTEFYSYEVEILYSIVATYARQKLSDDQMVLEGMPFTGAGFLSKTTPALSDDLLLLWFFDSSNKAIDQSNKLHYGEYYNSAHSTTTCNTGGCAYTDSTRYVRTNDSQTLSSPNNTRAFSLFVMMRPSAFGANRIILEKMESTNDREFSLLHNSGAGIVLQLSNTTHTVSLTFSNSSSLGVNIWHPIGLTVDAANNITRLYVNGTLSHSLEWDDSNTFITDSDGRFVISNESATGIVGYIDTVGYWNRSLSADEMEALARRAQRLWN